MAISSVKPVQVEMAEAKNVAVLSFVIVVPVSITFIAMVIGIVFIVNLMNVSMPVAGRLLGLNELLFVARCSQRVKHVVRVDLPESFVVTVTLMLDANEKRGDDNLVISPVGSEKVKVNGVSTGITIDSVINHSVVEIDP